jgi:anti-anti-sigma factor
MHDADFLVENTTLTVRLGQRLVAEKVPALQEQLKSYLDYGIRQIIFDFEDTMILDSSGIGLLIATGNSLKPLQGSMSVKQVTQEIMRLLSSMRLTERLDVTAKDKEA